MLSRDAARLSAATCRSWPWTCMSSRGAAERLSAKPLRLASGTTAIAARRRLATTATAAAAAVAASATTAESKSRLERVQNFRDVASCSPDTLRPGRLFRAARLDRATPQDWQTLVQQYGIRSAIDLRSEEEQKTSPPPGEHVQHHCVNITGPSYSRTVIAHLSLWQQAQLLFLAATGRRDLAVHLLGSQAIKPRGLLGLATDTLDASGPDIKSIMDTLASSDAWPTCVFCHSGKDRTGLVVALVLLLCRVDQAAVQADYARSVGPDGLPESSLEERVRDLEALGLPPDFAGVEPGLVAGVVKHCTDAYGSVDGYLAHIGVTEDAKRRVRASLLKK